MPIGLAVAIAVLAVGIGPVARSAPQEPPAQTAGSMKPYVETIPGTDVKFEMVPIPGGTFEMGSPAERRPKPRARTKGRSTPSRSRRSGWASTRSPGRSTTSSPSRWT